MQIGAHFQEDVLDLMQNMCIFYAFRGVKVVQRESQDER